VEKNQRQDHKRGKKQHHASWNDRSCFQKAKGKKALQKGKEQKGKKAASAMVCKIEHTCPQKAKAKKTACEKRREAFFESKTNRSSCEDDQRESKYKVAYFF